MKKRLALITIEELSEYLKISVKTLKKWKKEGKGPRAIQLSRNITRYDMNEVDKWLGSIDEESA
jgi:predicted DNA-binding transcriptional regulator AlpA